MNIKEEQGGYKTCIDKFPCSRFIYTFSYKNEAADFNELITRHTESGKWKLRDLYDTEHNELFEHISYLITSKPDTDNFKMSIASSMKKIDFKETHIKYKDKKLEFDFWIKNIWLVLFKTNIGCIIVDTFLDDDSNLDNLINLNYYFKSLELLNSHDNYNLFEIKKEKVSLKRNDTHSKDLISGLDIPLLEKDETVRKLQSKEVLVNLRLRLEKNYENHKKNVEIIDLNEIKLVKRNGEEELQYNYTIKTPFNYKELFISLFENIKVDTFFNNFFSKTYNRKLPSKAHVFTVTSVKGESKDEIPDLLFWLRKAYKKSYSPDEDSRKLENNEEVFKNFSNSIWGVSREGVANIVQYDCTFLKENYYSRLDIYFYLYLLVLHQYYGLLLLSRDAAELSSEPLVYMDPEEYNRLKTIRERLNFFYLKCIFNETSHISHQSTLYKYMWDRLGVHNILNEIQFEIERISVIIDDVREEQDIKHKNTQEKRSKIFMIIAAIFTIVSTFECVWSILSMAKQSYAGLGDKPIKLLWLTIKPPDIMLVLTILLILLFCILGCTLFALAQLAPGFKKFHSSKDNKRGGLYVWKKSQKL